MALNQIRHWLICYDIADKKRLTRVHRLIKKHSIPIQYSVYLAQASRSQIDQWFLELAEIINPKQDDIRAYLIPEHAQIHLIGQPILPDGMLLENDRMQSAIKLLTQPKK